MDTDRTENLNRYGYHVIRFRNAEVYGNLPDVLERIRRALLTIEQARSASTQSGLADSSPPPVLGEGSGVGA